MKCPKCQFENKVDAGFCNECGVKFEVPCPNCERANRPGSKFCDTCGQALVKTKEAPTADLSFEEKLDKLGKLARSVDVVRAADDDGDKPAPANILMMGALAGSGLLSIPAESYEEAMREIMAPKDLDMNLEAFRKGARCQ